MGFIVEDSRAFVSVPVGSGIAVDYYFQFTFITIFQVEHYSFFVKYRGPQIWWQWAVHSNQAAEFLLEWRLVLCNSKISCQLVLKSPCAGCNIHLEISQYHFISVASKWGICLSRDVTRGKMQAKLDWSNMKTDCLKTNLKFTVCSRNTQLLKNFAIHHTGYTSNIVQFSRLRRAAKTWKVCNSST